MSERKNILQTAHKFVQIQRRTSRVGWVSLFLGNKNFCSRKHSSTVTATTITTQEKVMNINFLVDIIFNRIGMIDDTKLFIVIEMQCQHKTKWNDNELSALFAHFFSRFTPAFAVCCFTFIFRQLKGTQSLREKHKRTTKKETKNCGKISENCRTIWSEMYIQIISSFFLHFQLIHSDTEKKTERKEEKNYPSKTLGNRDTNNKLTSTH